MSDLKVTSIQTHLYWEDKVKNREHFNTLLEKVENTDIIVLPEMFNTGFSMQSEKLYEHMNGETVLWLQEKAKQKDTLIIGSIIIKELGEFYNRLLCVFPDGEIKKYDKKHLFRMAKEDENYASGKELLTFYYKGWKICPLICYDLRFPVWSRNKFGIDLYIYVANWPTTRISAWDILLKARAIENLSYVVGVNRVGEDGKQIKYAGHSAVIDFKGENISSHPENIESILRVELSKNFLDDYRLKFPAHIDADEFKLL